MTSVHPPPPHASRRCLVMWQYTGTFVDPTSSKYAVFSLALNKQATKMARFIQNDIASFSFLLEHTSLLRNLANLLILSGFLCYGYGNMFWSRVGIAAVAKCCAKRLRRRDIYITFFFLCNSYVIGLFFCHLSLTLRFCRILSR